MSATYEQHLLMKLAEEASEIAQIALKTAYFGQDEKYVESDLDNRQRCHAEITDLLGIVDMLNEKCGFNFTFDSMAIRAKAGKVDHYARYSASLGLTELPEFTRE